MTTRTTRAIRTSAPPRVGLAVLHALFQRIDTECVPYCHWKSNEHLDASMRGAADLDLLVAREAALDFERVLAELGFKRFGAVSGRAYPGVEDHLGFDAATGGLAHLHVHYELTLGERYLKGYRIPWERVLLARRVREPSYGLWVADPTSELLLLLVRATIKVRWRDRLLAGRDEHAMPAGMSRELRWLLERTEIAAVASLAREVLGEDAARALSSLFGGRGPTASGLRALRRSIAPSLAAWRTYGAGEALGRRWWREAASRLGRLRRSVSPVERPSRRVVPRGGVLVAFVGADGSGKSTLVAATAAWLAAKLDVVPVYGGSGVGSAGVPRRVLERGRLIVRRLGGARRHADATHRGDRTMPPTADAPKLVSLGRLAWILALARERRKRTASARHARNRGMIVLSDRIAQSQFTGINDGPRLGDPSQYRSFAHRAVAAYERETFQATDAVAPDLVVRLHLPYEVAAERKPDTPPEQLRRKLALVGQLRWPPASRVVEIDAARSLDEVLLDVKRAVWEAL